MIHVVALKNTLKSFTNVTLHAQSKTFVDVNLVLHDTLVSFSDIPPFSCEKLFQIQKRVIRGVWRSVPHQSVANTNNGMSVDLNARSLNAVKEIIVVQTKDVQPSVNQDANVLKELVHFLTVTPYFRLKSDIYWQNISFEPE